jgi:hypothetical protein
MPITWTSIPLDEPQELRFPDGQEIMIDCRDTNFDHLGVWFSFGLDRVLPRAVDADESLEWPRVTVFTGNNPSEMFYFGGPIAYRLRSDGEIVQRVDTHRDLADYECGSLDVLRHQNIAVIVYEVGILAIDADLRPLWLKRKYMGKYETTIEDDLLKLQRRFMRPVVHRLSDGELISSPRDYSPGLGRRALPDQHEMIRVFLGALDAEGTVRALTPIVGELTGRAKIELDRERSDRLRTLVASKIEAARTAEPAHGLDDAFIEALIAGWSDLGRDLKALQRMLVKGVYAWPWR